MLTSGRVHCVRVGDDYGFTTIVNPITRLSETFTLWYSPGGVGVPSELTAYTRIMHSMWISLLRDARANNLPVTIVHNSGSAIVTAVHLGY